MAFKSEELQIEDWEQSTDIFFVM